MKTRAKTKKTATLKTATVLAGLSRFRKAAKNFTKRTTRSRATALRTLVDEGIYTKSGKLTKNYR